jgi:putative flippase GtrA
MKRMNLEEKSNGKGANDDNQINARRMYWPYNQPTVMAPKAAKYLVVGTLAFVIDFGVTWALVQHLPLLVANTIGFIVANVANFLLAHRWVFRAPFTRAAIFASYLPVLGVSVVGLVINNLIVWLLVAQLALALLIGKVVAALAAFIWNFLARAKWIYNDDSNSGKDKN